METHAYRELLPVPRAIDALAYVRSLTLEHAANNHGERPYTVVNFVSSVDGHTTVDGLSRKLSGRADRELFYALRERADAVLVGTRTLAAEQYKRMLPEDTRRERRIASGQPAEPLTVTVTRSGSVPLEIPLFDQTPDRVLVFQGRDVTLPEVMHSLRRDHGVDTLLCEGGPTLFGALLREHLVDELFLTLAPTLVGGSSGPAVISGSPHESLESPASLTLAGVLERDGTLFLRYRID